MAHPNEELVRKAYEAFSKGDMGTLRGLFAEDVVYHTGGRSPIAGDFRGIDETLQSFAKIFELSGGTFKVEIHDVLANDEHAVVLAFASGKRDGKSLDQRYAHVLHLKDRKFTESWIHNEDQYAADDFWS